MIKTRPTADQNRRQDSCDDWQRSGPVRCSYALSYSNQNSCGIKGRLYTTESPGKKNPLLDRKSRRSSSGLPFSSHFLHSAVLSLHRPDTLIDGIEMLHFRSTVALKELFQTQLKRPLTGRVGVNAAPATSVSFSTAGLDGRSPGRGRAFAAWRAPPHFTRRHGVRDFCSKGDGQNDAAKDSEKWVTLTVVCVLVLAASCTVGQT